MSDHVLVEVSTVAELLILCLVAYEAWVTYSDRAEARRTLPDAAPRLPPRFISAAITGVLATVAWVIVYLTYGGGSYGYVAYAAAVVLVASLALAIGRTATAHRQELPRPVSTAVPLSEGWLEQQLTEAGFDRVEVEAHSAACFRFLHMGNIVTQADALAFIRDVETRDEIERMYRQELRRTDPREAYGFCYWGPALHLAPPEKKALVRAHIQQAIRAHFDPATGRERARDVQDQELADLARTVMPLLRVTRADEYWATKYTYKLKLYVQVANETGREIRVARPSGWTGLDLQTPPSGAPIASSLQLWDGERWGDEAPEIVVPPGRVFRFWLGFDPAIGLDRLKELRGKVPLGRVTLPVVIADRQAPWSATL